MTEKIGGYAVGYCNLVIIFSARRLGFSSVFESLPIIGFSLSSEWRLALLLDEYGVDLIL